MENKMLATIIDSYGGNEVVDIRRIERPRPQEGEVLVRVHTAGVNPIDWKIRDGAGQRLGLTLPIGLGSEIAGTVTEVGEGVSVLKVGDAVFGMVKSGGFAEYVAAKASDVIAKPANLDFTDAAAVPLGGLTAWQAMFDIAGLRSGQRLLITNSSGGVGSLAVQFAKAKGVHVTGMASAHNREFVQSLGVDAFIDYTKQPFEQVARDMDVVFDTVGGDTFQRAFRTLKKGGFMVTATAFPQNEAAQYEVRVGRVFCTPNSEQLAAIRDLVEAEKVRAFVSTVLPLTEVRRALNLSGSGRTRGKIILQLAE